MLDINGATIGVTLGDGTDINVEIEPVHAEMDGHLQSTSVYELSSSELNNVDLGSIAFSMVNHYEWLYTGEVLSHNEVEQIVEFIQKENISR